MIKTKEGISAIIRLFNPHTICSQISLSKDKIHVIWLFSFKKEEEHYKIWKISDWSIRIINKPIKILIQK